MRLLPAVAEADLGAAGLAIGELQRVVGDYFAPAQGARFTSPDVAEILAWIEGQGSPASGQSSWGPTGFALLPDEGGGRAGRAGPSRAWPRSAGPFTAAASSSSSTRGAQPSAPARVPGLGPATRPGAWQA